MSEQNSSGNGFLDGNPKTMFVFGLVSGMALVLLFNNFTGVSLAGNGGTVRNPDAGNRVVVNDDPAAPSGELKGVSADEHIRGDINKAKVVMIEYSDFECPFCGRHHPSMLQAMEEYGDQIAWVYRHFPLTSIHPQAEPAANASECAAEQGKFWEYGDKLVENQDGLSATYYTELAADLGLNKTKFADCLSSSKYQSIVDADTASGQAAGVTGTPATFINGRMVSGAVPYATLKKLIDEEMAK